MKHYSLVIDPKLVKEIDEMIKKRGIYSSRSDFIRDSIRQRLIEVKKMLGEKDTVKEEKEKREARKQEAIVEEVMEEKRFTGVH